MQYLSENNIKSVTLRFLKTYYKFRPRAGETHLDKDLESQDGIVADGRLVFPVGPNDKFVATFEATSYLSRDEVAFKLQSKLLLWDALAVSLLVCAFLYSWGFTYGYITIEQLGATRYFSLLGICLFFCCWFYQILFQNSHKYRYIYAIEQFKQYHANEQWISIGEDVFETEDKDLSTIVRKQYKELRDQCIMNGFGLIVVNLDLEPHLMITPSRQELFGKKRSQKDFMDALHRGEEAKKIGIKDQLRAGLDRSIKSASSLLRFKKSFYLQFFLSAISLGMLGSLSYLQLRDDSQRYVDELSYEKSMESKKKEFIPEKEGFSIDSSAIDDLSDLNTPYEEELENGTEEFEEELVIAEERSFRRQEILVASGKGQKTTQYDCERFYNIHQKVFIIQEGTYKNIEAAQTRIAKLKRAGFAANALWLGCFTRSNADYVVYLDMMYESKNEALDYSAKFQKKLSKLKGPEKSLKIRSINRKN